MQEQKDYLTDMEQEIVRTPATPGLRFVNYIIDGIVYTFFLGFFGVRILVVSNISTLYLVCFAALIGYYTIMEGATGGKTIGKFATKTRAVKEDGSKLTFGDAFIRSLCRLVPFEPLSTFSGYPWHDKWSKTRVIKE